MYEVDQNCLFPAPLVLAPTNSPVYAHVSEPAFLKCEVNVTRPTHYIWTKLNGGTANTFTTADHAQKYSDGYKYFFRTRSTLTIANVELEHYGTYNCHSVDATNDQVTLIVNCEYLS